MQKKLLVIMTLFLLNSSLGFCESYPLPKSVYLAKGEAQLYLNDPHAKETLSEFIKADKKNKYSEIGGFVYLVKHGNKSFFEFIDIESYNSMMAKKVLACGDNQKSQEKVIEDYIHGFKYICGESWSRLYETIKRQEGEKRKN